MKIDIKQRLARVSAWVLFFLLLSNGGSLVGYAIRWLFEPIRPPDPWFSFFGSPTQACGVSALVLVLGFRCWRFIRETLPAMKRVARGSSASVNDRLTWVALTLGLSSMAILLAWEGGPSDALHVVLPVAVLMLGSIIVFQTLAAGIDERESIDRPPGPVFR